MALQRRVIRTDMKLIYVFVRQAAFAAAIGLGVWIIGQTQTPSPTPTPAPPATDIFVIDLSTRPGGKLKLGQPVKITNWAGYNNQPSFLPDGKSILYTSIRDKQADIYRYDLRAASTTQVTN